MPLNLRFPASRKGGRKVLATQCSQQQRLERAPWASPPMTPPRPIPPLHLIAPYSSMKAPAPAGSSTAGDQKSSGAGVVPNAAWAAGTATPAVSSAVSRAPTDSEVSAMVSLSSLFSSRRISSGVSVGSTARVDTMRATLRAVGEHGGEMRF